MTETDNKTREARRRAVRELAALDLPVGEPGEMKEESVPHPDDYLILSVPSKNPADPRPTKGPHNR